MKIHKEGFLIIVMSSLILAGLQFLNYVLYQKIEQLWIFIAFTLLFVLKLFLIIQFFRVPKRIVQATGEMDIICPADGKVVVIEEVEESEYFNDKRIQISIFMSPLNVHANWSPIKGVFKYVNYHKGLFLVAWHPKSSTDNERSTFVIAHESGKEILFRQIAGAVARRICYYVEEGQKIEAGDEFGFIKFGSRIDVFLPLGTVINVKIGDVVKGKLSKLATLIQ